MQDKIIVICGPLSADASAALVGCQRLGILAEILPYVLLRITTTIHSAFLQCVASISLSCPQNICTGGEAHTLTTRSTKGADETLLYMRAHAKCPSLFDHWSAALRLAVGTTASKITRLMSYGIVVTNISGNYGVWRVGQHLHGIFM